MSLGLPRERFDSSVADDSRAFDAVLNADASHPNGLWLFKGSDYYLYDLLDDAVVEGPTPLTQPWGAGALPELFRSGIHSAVWGGPAFPNVWTFFKDDWYYSMDAARGWAQSEGPRGVLGAWATGVWTAPDGTWLTPGVPVALHGVGSRFDGMVHFFKDGKYLRHNLRTGGLEAGPISVGEEWNLPEAFLDRIDYAFYGTGAHEEHINFISGDHYLLYDFRRQAAIDEGSVEKRFPVFAQFINRPQLFLAEDYVMVSMVGPVSLGRLIDTRSIGAGSKIQKLLVTETTDRSLQTLRQSMLTSQDTQVTNDFYDRVDTNLSSEDSSDSYRYQLNAQFHGDASATSMWGGEVNADLGVQGQTDTLRSRLSQAAFKSIGSQLEQTKRQTEQKTYDSAAEISSSVHVLRKEFFEETNTSDRVRVYEFYEQLQAYITFLVLQGVVLVYSDGVTRPKTAQLPDVQRLLEEVLSDPQEVPRVIDYLRQELSHVTGYDGQVHSLLASTPMGGGLALRNNLASSYTVALPDGSRQELTQDGLIKAARSWVQPTFTITPVQK
jgi:hypothetical protein